MDALAAPLVHVQRSDALWLIPAAPVIGAWARRFVTREPKGQPHLLAALAPTGVALLVALSQVYALTSLDADARHLIAPGPTPLRVGSMELGLALAFDPLAAVMALALATLALAAQAHRAWNDEQPDAAIDIAATGGLLAVLADGFFGLLVGAALASSAVAYAAARSRVIDRVGDAALTLGAALLFWSLGGMWGISVGYEPTYTRRNPIPEVAQLDTLEVDQDAVGPAFTPVVIGAPPAAVVVAPKSPTPDLSSRGYLTIASPSGARVFLKGSMEPIGVTPILHHEVYSGRMDIEIERLGEDGRALRRQRFRAVDIPAGREVALVTLGPSLTFRPIREQLLLTDNSHRPFVRDLLDPSVPGHRRLGSFDAITLIALLFGLAAFAPLVSAAFAGPSLLIEAVVPLVAIYLLARVGFLFTLSPVAASIVSIAFAIFAALSALRAATDHRASNVLARVLAAHLAIAAAAAVLGAPGLGVLHAISASFACAIGLVLLDSLGVRGLRRVSGLGESAPATARTSRIATLAIAGPLLGAAFTRESILGRAFASDVPYAKAAWALLVVAAIAMAVAAWRAWFVVFEGPRGEPIDDPTPRFTLALMLAAVAVALLPPILALSRASALSFGSERSIIESFLDPSIDPGAVLGADRAARFQQGRGSDLGALAVVVLGTVAAWFLMRRRFRDDDRPKIGVRELTMPRLPLSSFARLDELVFTRPVAALAGLLARRKKA